MAYIKYFSPKMNLCHKNNKACLYFLIIGIGLAFYSLTPQGINLEEEFGLPILFKMRGTVPAPKNIIIVSIDEASTRILNLPDNREKVPRVYYARLINIINQQSPALIALNMTFVDKKDVENDQLLAQAMLKGNNVILSSILRRPEMIPGTGLLDGFKFEKIIGSTNILEDAALASAPLVLPKTASTVKQFWVYKNSAGDIETLPTTIFQQYLLKRVKPEITELLQEFNEEYKRSFPTEPDPKFADNISFQEIKTALKNSPQNIGIIERQIMSKEFSRYKKQLLTGWLSLLGQPDILYLNYYGGTETFSSISFYQVLDSIVLNPSLFKDKIVLVGYSKSIAAVNSSGLYTVFSDGDDDSTSPIEITATAVANLLENTWLKPLSPLSQFFLIISWSLLLSAISVFFPYKQAMGTFLALAIGYLAISYQQFVTSSVWIPLSIALLVQIPLIATLISIAFFFREKQEHQNMQRAFGSYVPNNVVVSMAQQQDIKAMNHFGEFIKGTCMSTDAGQYTALSEKMEPLELHHFINQYYGVMFPLVRKHQGIISDVVGDAMFAIWNATETGTQARVNACSAALKIRTAVDNFNQSQPHQLHTRLGLNFGNFRLGNVGATGHFEYRAVGDIVNTATRIESLNKLLGTQILVTSDVISGLQQFLSREIGFFMLPGKAQSVHVFELISETDASNPHSLPLLTMFSAALKLFQQREWAVALGKWIEIEQSYPNDGPTLFYIQFLKQNLHLVPAKTAEKSQPATIKIGNITTPLLLDE